MQEFKDEQVNKHCEIESISINDITGKIDYMDSEINKADDVIETIEGISDDITSIKEKLDTDLEESFNTFVQDISEEMGVERTREDFVFLLNKKDHFIQKLNENIDSLIEDLNSAVDASLKFRDLKESILIHYSSEIVNLLEDIENYINALDEKKEEIKEIIEEYTDLKNKINSYNENEYSSFPSYESIINLESELDHVLEAKINELLKELQTEALKDEMNVEEEE